MAHWKCKIFIFPLFCSCLMVFIIVLMYYWATARGDVVAWLPTISETGSQLPERGVFSYLMFIESLMTGLSIYFRYRHLKWMNVERKAHVDKLNKVAAASGYVAALGMVGVASFPESTQLELHLVCAILLFATGACYMVFDAIISYAIRCGRVLVALRAILATGGLVISLLTGFFFVTSRFAWNKGYHDHSRNMRTEEDAGYDEYTASAGFEWGLILALIVYFVTIAFEFADLHTELKIHSPATSDPSHGERLNLSP